MEQQRLGMLLTAAYAQVYWSWSDNAWLADGAKDTLGYRDFAGSGVVHMTGTCTVLDSKPVLLL